MESGKSGALGGNCSYKHIKKKKKRKERGRKKGRLKKDQSTVHDKKIVRDFLGDPMVKNLPSSARDWGSIPGQGSKIPQTEEQPSPCATTTEAQVESLCAATKNPSCCN